jgi:hypothetical protein
LAARGSPPTFTVNVDSAEVKPVGTFDLLGVTFDRQFRVKPYLHSLARESCFRAGRVARLAQHLPPGQLLRQLGSGLLMGKVAHCLPVVLRPRLPGSTAAIPKSLAQVQVAVNDVTRSVVGCKREDHITIVDLLKAAKYFAATHRDGDKPGKIFPSNFSTECKAMTPPDCAQGAAAGRRRRPRSRSRSRSSSSSRSRSRPRSSGTFVLPHHAFFPKRDERFLKE